MGGKEEEEEEKQEKSAKGVSEEWERRLREFFLGFEFDEDDLPDFIDYFRSGELEEIF